MFISKRYFYETSKVLRVINLNKFNIKISTKPSDKFIYNDFGKMTAPNDYFKTTMRVVFVSPPALKRQK